MKRSLRFSCPKYLNYSTPFSSIFLDKIERWKAAAMIPQFFSLTFSTVSKLGDYYLVLFHGDLLSYLKGTLALDPAQAS